MIKKISIPTFITITVLVIGAFLFNTYHFYTYLLLTNTREYPTGWPAENLVVYKINPGTILASLDEGKTDVFIPAPENPIYDNVPPLELSSPLSWNQEDFLKVAGALHQYVWKESLNSFHLYSMSFTTPRCKDISQLDGAGFKFYQRRENWYYLVHDINIDLQLGYVYAGDTNGYYTGRWKDIDLDQAAIHTAGQALLIAEQNGGRAARLAVRESQECQASVDFPPSAYEHTDWKWEVTYWINHGTSVLFKIAIDPFSGNYEISSIDK